MRVLKSVLGVLLLLIGGWLVSIEIGMAISEPRCFKDGWSWLIFIFFCIIGIAMVICGVRLIKAPKGCPSNTSSRARRFQYRLSDLLGASLLAGLNMLILTKYLDNGPDASKQFALGLISITFALAAAYLTVRLAMEGHVDSSIGRFGLLLLIELVLILFYPGIPLIAGKIFGWQ